jgi:hypothetical protein
MIVVIVTIKGDSTPQRTFGPFQTEGCAFKWLDLNRPSLSLRFAGAKFFVRVLDDPERFQ